jgi:hypothetical protein
VPVVPVCPEPDLAAQAVTHGSATAHPTAPRSAGLPFNLEQRAVQQVPARLLVTVVHRAAVSVRLRYLAATEAHKTTRPEPMAAAAQAVRMAQVPMAAAATV